MPLVTQKAPRSLNPPHQPPWPPLVSQVRALALQGPFKPHGPPRTGI